MDKKIIAAFAITAIAVTAILLIAGTGGRKPPAMAPPNITYGLSGIKIASVYEDVTDPIPPSRATGDVISMLRETNTELIFRGFWRWGPVPESPETSWNENYTKRHYTYKDLGETISRIKKEMPNVTFVGAIQVIKIERTEINDLTGEVLDENDTWAMALDPAKWGLGPSKEEVQEANMKRWFGGLKPDITSPAYQELLLAMAKKQIDLGADGIWIDFFYSQAAFFAKTANVDINHPAMRDSFDAASRIVDEIHRYGESKGKYIYVGTWVDPALSQSIAYSKRPALDFLTASPTPQEVANKNFNGKKWDEELSRIRQVFGDIPVFVFLDWGFPDSQLEVFSQKFSDGERAALLGEADEFFTGKGTVFVYPLHGGDMGDKPPKRAFSQEYPPGFRYYDSLAPEFRTYETIKELARGKAG